MKITSGVSHPMFVAAAAKTPEPRRRPPAQRPASAMPARRLTALSVVACAALWGCSSLPTWRVEPAFRIESGGANPGPGLLALAQQYEGEGRVEQALQAYAKAAQAAPADADLHNTVGLALARHGRFGDAVTALRRAVALAPERAPLLNNLAYALLLDGRAEDARAMWRLTLAVDPAHTMASRNLAHVDQQLANAATPAAAPVLAAQRAPAAAPASVAKEVVQVAQAAPPAAAAAAAAEPTSAPLRWSHSGGDVIELQRLAPTPKPVEITLATLPSLPALPALPGLSDVAKPVNIEVSNGAGRSGLAKGTAQALRASGHQAAQVTNHTHFKVQQTEIQYRSSDDAFAARRLARSFALPVALAPNPALRQGIDLRVLLGRDAAELMARTQRVTQLKPGEAPAHPNVTASRHPGVAAPRSAAPSPRAHIASVSPAQGNIIAR